MSVCFGPVDCLGLGGGGLLRLFRFSASFFCFNLACVLWACCRSNCYNNKY